MGINPNQLSIIDNTGSSATEGSVILARNTGDHVWSSNSTGSVKIPSGTTAQRNSAPSNGMLRFNTQTRSVEIYSDTAPIGWRTAGQLNISGTASAPAISFSANQNTGFFQPTTNQIALSVAGAQRVLWTATNQTISTNLTVLGTITATSIVFSGPTAALAPLPTETLPLNDAVTNAVVEGSLTYSAASRSGMVVDYILKRGLNFKVGTFVVANNTATATLTDQVSSSTANIGVTFGVNVSGGNVVVNYTSVPSGQSIVGKFSIRKWDSF